MFFIGGLSAKGFFKFTYLSLDDQVLTRGSDIDEISVILTKREKDSRYVTLNQDIINWVSKTKSDGSCISILTLNKSNLSVKTLLLADF